ncbi:Spo0B domain-containing protein [Virgibacillus sp. W0430]|uniref:Spo0B domain-containing protein n=1 Tax=Virgibacillus sp. W0430 TaxID=3391580 RepID=UPI003F44CF5D
MNEEKLVQFIQNYRHDILNELQIIQGYINMEMNKKVNEKVAQVVDNFHNERKLLSLQAPKFAIWVMQFNHVYGNIRITYDMFIENLNLQSTDDQLVLLCANLMHCLEKHSEKDAFFEGKLSIHKQADNAKIIVDFSFDGKDLCLENFKKCVQKDKIYDVLGTDTGFNCRFTVPCH